MPADRIVEVGISAMIKTVPADRLRTLRKNVCRQADRHFVPQTC
jgi:hypothetical protein